MKSLILPRASRAAATLAGWVMALAVPVAAYAQQAQDPNPTGVPPDMIFPRTPSSQATGTVTDTAHVADTPTENTLISLGQVPGDTAQASTATRAEPSLMEDVLGIREALMFLFGLATGPALWLVVGMVIKNGKKAQS